MFYHGYTVYLLILLRLFGRQIVKTIVMQHIVIVLAIPYFFMLFQHKTLGTTMSKKINKITNNYDSPE